MPGIRAKFQQNPNLMEILLSKTSSKKIVECSNDNFWGTGIPINKPECLNQSNWTSQGILGEILEEIQFEAANVSSYGPNYIATRNCRPWNTSYSTDQIGVSVTPNNVPKTHSINIHEPFIATPNQNLLQNVSSVSTIPALKSALVSVSALSAMAPTVTVSTQLLEDGGGADQTGIVVNAVEEPSASDKLDKLNEPANEIIMVEDAPATDL